MRKVGMGSKDVLEVSKTVPYEDYMKAVEEIERLQKLASELQAEIKELKTEKVEKGKAEK